MTKRIGTWDELKLHPTTLVRLVVEGKAVILGKDKHGRYIYRLMSKVKSTDI